MIIHKVIKLFDKNEKKEAVILLCLIIFSGFLEMVNLGLLIPFMTLLTQSDISEQSLFIQNIYYVLNYESYNNFLLTSGILLVISIILANFIRGITTWWSYHFTYLQDYSISKKLFSIYLNQPYEFFLTRNTSELSKNILNEVGVMVGGVIITGMMVITKICITAFITGFLLWMNPLATLSIAALFVVFYGGIYWVFHKKIEVMGKMRHDLASKRFAYVKEAFSNIKETKIYKLEEYFLRLYGDVSKKSSQYSAKQAVIGMLPAYVMEALGVTATLSFILFSIIFYGQDFVTLIPILSVYLFAGYRLLPNVQQMFGGIARIRFTLPVLNTMFKEFLMHDDFVEQQKNHLAGNPKKRSNAQAIEIENVSFHYGEGKKGNVLKDISLKISKNKITAIMGHTGSGKTTLVDLILRLLEPSQGMVKLFGHDVLKMGHENWYKNFAYVSQNITLFDDTIANNIALQAKKTPKVLKKISDIMELLEMDSVVEGLNGLQGEAIGENGKHLSGGQRQRISIARALYRDPEILIFDEATSALDSQTEENILKRLSKEKNKTLILITHSHQALSYCDNIIIMDNGGVKSQGSYKTLMNKNLIKKKSK